MVTLAAACLSQEKVLQYKIPVARRRTATSKTGYLARGEIRPSVNLYDTIKRTVVRAME